MKTDIQPDRAHHLASILRAIEDCERAKADYNADWKARMETLRQQAWKLGNEILSGQLTMTDVMERVAEEVNAGALDGKGVTCTAKVRK